MKSENKIICFALVSCLFFSCKHDKDQTTPVTLVQGINLNIGYKVDNFSFLIDTFLYITDVGYQYKITKLNYYLSQLSLIKSDSTTLLLKDYQYVDAVVPSTNQLTLKNIPAGDYIGLQFNIGLDSIHNISNALATTADNINMQWPDPMGGGYHFLKFEGDYIDSSGNYGFAMHVGTNTCLIPVKIFKHVVILTNKTTPVNMVMNINEWFRNPNLFDFDVDGNYIMGNAAAMNKIAENGVDVFNF